MIDPLKMSSPRTVAARIGCGTVRRPGWAAGLWCGLFLVASVGCQSGDTKQATPPIPAAPAAEGRSENAVRAPETFDVLFTTTQGNFTIRATRAWSPNGADRFYELVKAQYFDQCKFFRAVPGFMVQFGISGDPQQNAKWRPQTIPDDPVLKSNLRGYVTFAKTGMPNSRTTQLFINYKDNSNLDGMGFAPFAVVLDDGMKIVDQLYQGYGEEPSQFQMQIQQQGNAFLEKGFPKLDAIVTARLVDPAAEPATSAAAPPAGTNE